MARALAATLALTSIGIVAAPGAAALSCAPPNAADIRASPPGAVVFSGTIQAIDEIGDSLIDRGLENVGVGSDGESGVFADYTIDVERVFHGTSGRTLTVRAEHGGDWGLDASVGDELQMSTWINPDTGEQEIGPCSFVTEDVIAELGPGNEPEPEVETEPAVPSDNAGEGDNESDGQAMGTSGGGGRGDGPDVAPLAAVGTGAALAIAGAAVVVRRRSGGWPASAAEAGVTFTR